MAAKHPHTTDEYLSSVARMIRAAGRRVAHEDPEQLAALVALHEAVSEAVEAAVYGQRQSGIWWSSIAEALGVSKQAVIQRWAAKVDAMAQLHANDVNYLPYPGAGKAALPAEWRKGSEAPKGTCPQCEARVMTNPDGSICGHQQHDAYGQPVRTAALLR